MRVAVVECGRIAKVHVDALRQVGNAELVGVCDFDRWRAEALAESVPGAKVYADWQALLETEHPQVAHILTLPTAHAELAIQAMKAGCHVLAQNPWRSIRKTRTG